MYANIQTNQWHREATSPFPLQPRCLTSLGARLTSFGHVNATEVLLWAIARRQKSQGRCPRPPAGLFGVYLISQIFSLLCQLEFHIPQFKNACEATLPSFSFISYPLLSSLIFTFLTAVSTNYDHLQTRIP
ncbi:hypothetical protein BT63DRAFT_40471 [Microthyrium microscopicum]|uniref:Uncharacterized protein n=1 Tax=Microthyrium microscopicum TaxID=703497 RepID=A0A6A6UUK6_9PEZI|nr:hypothetical protein BT63DRAFT_40471 [Microthyrium microscopicum]